MSGRHYDRSRLTDWRDWPWSDRLPRHAHAKPFTIGEFAPILFQPWERKHFPNEGDRVKILVGVFADRWATVARVEEGDWACLGLDVERYDGTLSRSWYSPDEVSL